MNLEQLFERPDIWRGRYGVFYDRKVLPTGFACLDECLTGGGWPCGALTEILLPHEGIGELRLLMPALARLSREQRWLAWVAPPHVLYAPALAACGIDLSRVLIVRPRAMADGFWAVEQALCSGTCAAVLAWPAGGDTKVLRRLQLAAEKGRCWGVLFRSEQTAVSPSPAALRMRLQALPNGLAVHPLKQRGCQRMSPVIVKL